MNVLILGSEGFIGSHISLYFRGKGYDVTCADIVLKNEPGYLLINPKVPDFSSLFMNRAFDLCINATGAANVQLSMTNPGIDFSLNTANVFNMLDAIYKYCPGCKFLNLSSAAVYGNPAELPVKETAVPRPLSPYGFHKLYSEQICNEFFQFFQIPTLGVRIFSAYGPGLKKQLYWDLYKKAMQAGGRAVTVYGTGDESRDFIHVKDIARALEHIFLNMEFKGNSVNLASGTETTIREAVGIFFKWYDPGMSIIFSGEKKEGDPRNWVADISLLKTSGFTPAINLEEGLKELVSWIKAERH